MKKNRKNEELQSRREFFKKAAKGALPILGAIVVAGTPLLSIAKTHESEVESGCGWTCYLSCKTGCKQSCYISCANDCSSGCRNSCYTSCSGGCSTQAYAR